MQQSSVTPPSWSLDQIPFDVVDTERVRSREDLFYLVTAASFIEIASDLYTENLVQYFNDSDEVMHWLEHKWQHEEMRHGYSLRDYVAHVWPEFDWQAAYDAFFDEYSKLCTVEEFEPTRALEMAARCVVETGTATFYTALSDQADEPVLAGISSRIRAEEVGHYKYFYKYFRQYSQAEKPGRLRIFRAIKTRVLEARNSDADIALWHVYCQKNGIAVNAEKTADFRALCRQLGRQIKRHYPVTMAAKMILRPLDLPKALNRLIEGPLASAATWILR